MLQHVRTLQRATEIVHQCLPTPLRPHCAVANWRDGVLILTASSSAWTAKIRFYLPELKKLLLKNRELDGISEVVIRTEVRASEPAIPPRRRAILSPESAQILRSLATHTDHPELSDALQRLAKRSRFGKDA